MLVEPVVDDLPRGAELDDGAVDLERRSGGGRRKHTLPEFRNLPAATGNTVVRRMDCTRVVLGLIVGGIEVHGQSVRLPEVLQHIVIQTQYVEIPGFQRFLAAGPFADLTRKL